MIACYPFRNFLRTILHFTQHYEQTTIHQTPGRGIGAAVKRTPAIHSGRIGREAGRQNNPCIASGRSGGYDEEF